MLLDGISMHVYSACLNPLLLIDLLPHQIGILRKLVI